MAAIMNKARVALALPVLLSVAACESSSRLGSMLPGSGGGYAPPPRVSQRAAPAPLTPAPIGDVQTSDLSGGSVASSSLPPPSSSPSPSMLPRSGGLSAPGNFGSSGAPIDPPPAPSVPSSPSSPTYYPAGSGPAGAAPSGANPTPPRVATAPSAPASRTSVVGNWSVSEAQGSSCRITLSSAPKLDLYGAGTSGCQTKELQRVNAWELSGSELLLYEPGGGVVARLRQGGSGYAGATARTGAPVSLSK